MLIMDMDRGDKRKLVAARRRGENVGTRIRDQRAFPAAHGDEGLPQKPSQAGGVEL